MTIYNLSIAGSLTHQIVVQTKNIPRPGQSILCESLTHLPGGKGANIAVAAHRACHARPFGADYRTRSSQSPLSDHEIQVFMNGAVGDDALGPPLKSALADQGLDVNGVLILPGAQTGQAVVMVEVGRGENCALGFRGANQHWKPAHDDLKSLAGASDRLPDMLVAQCTLDTQVVLDLMREARRLGIETILSASPVVSLPREIYRSIDHLIVNEHEALELSGQAQTDLKDIDALINLARQFVAFGVQQAVITLGERGAIFATQGSHTGHVAAVSDVAVVDTTGAGDSFVGAYAVDLLRQRGTGGRDIGRAVQFANKVAAHTISKLGSQTALPWADDLA